MDDFGWMIQNSPSLLLMMDESLVCQSMATAWRERLEPELSKRQAIPAARLFDFENDPELVDRFVAVATEGHPIVNTAVTLLIDDEPMPGRFSAWRAQSGADEPACIVVAATDVSKYRDAIENLSQLQMRHSLILDSAGEGIYGLDAEGRLTFGNAAAEAIVGWRTEDVLGQKSHDVHHHSYPDGSKYPRDKCPIYAALKDGEVHQVDTEVFWHADGSAIPVEYTSTPILKDGKPDGAVVVFRDISKRIEMEQKLEAEHEEMIRLKTTYQLILDSAGEGIYGKDREGCFTFGNAATETILGWRIEDVIGQNSHDVHHHSYPDGSPYPREACPISAAAKEGKSVHFGSEVFWHANGSMVPVEYTSTPILKDGTIEGAVMVFRDVSEKKTLEEQRDKAFEEIKQLKDRLEQERDYLRDEVKTVLKHGEIIGESESLKRTLTQIEAVASTPASVLILGESGTGKELIARDIHNQSNRADEPLVKVNCASIPKDLFESEFFGHIKGAFTGAHQDRIGRIQLADGGTLFLDEVGEIPLSQQGKLLRALQEHEFERVGDGKTIKANVRVIAATNRDLEMEIEGGRFREDLYYRLSVFPIKVPSLRERVDDIAHLAVYFVELTCKEFGREPLKLSKQQVNLLKQHKWPGNIRELKNVIERSVILSAGNRINLDLAIPSSQTKDQSTLKASSDSEQFVPDAQIREIEKSNMISALRHANWQVWGEHGAAHLLGIKPSTLTYRMKGFGIEKDK